MSKSNFVKPKKKVNVTVKLDPDDLQDAKQANINISKVCRYALKLAIEGKLVEVTGEQKPA